MTTRIVGQGSVSGAGASCEALQGPHVLAISGGIRGFLGTFGIWALLTGCVGHVGSNGQGLGGGASQTNGGTGTGSPPGSAAGANTGTGAGVGAPGASGTGAGTTTTMGSAPTSGTTPGAAPPTTCTGPQAAAVRLRLLSGTQYDNSVLDLLQVGGDPAKDFGDQVFQQLDDTRVEQRANAAAAVAHQAAATLSTWSPCSSPAPGATPGAATGTATGAVTAAVTACEQQIIDQVGASAFRHPLAADERASMKTLFDAGITEKDFATGVEWFLTGVLQSPDFMYEIVKPAVGEVAGEVRPLAPYEYASRLSYFMWDSLPDAKLFAAAAADELGDPTKRQVHLQRMIKDPRFMRGVERFYSSWLNVGAFSEVARDAAGFTGDVVTALSTSLLMSATQLYAADAPNFSSLFSGETYYLNDVLRTFYGVPSSGVAGSGTGFQPATLGGQGRHGIVTHPALMALLARPAESFPIARGLFVLRSLLCMDVPPPPAGLTIPQLPAIQDGLSTRHRLEAHVTDPACSICHKVFDPPGLALESFDEVGRYRTIDHGAPVDTAVTIALNSDLDGSFSQGDAFVAKMTSSVSVRSCFSRQVLEFALSRQSMDPADACSLDAVARSFAPSGDLKQLVASVASSDAFRLRLAEGVAP